MRRGITSPTPPTRTCPGAQLRIGNLPRTESTGVHSIDDLVVGARGPHADAFRGFMNSTEVFRIMSEALALGNK